MTKRTTPRAVSRPPSLVSKMRARCRSVGALVAEWLLLGTGAVLTVVGACDLLITGTTLPARVTGLAITSVGVLASVAATRALKRRLRRSLLVSTGGVFVAWIGFLLMLVQLRRSGQDIRLCIWG